MKRTLVLGTLVAGTAAVLPNGLYAQQQVMVLSSGGSQQMTLSIGGGSIGTGRSSADGAKQKGAEAEQQLQKLLSQSAADGKHAIVILDSVQTDDKTLTNFMASLRDGKIGVRQGGMRVLPGDDKEAKKYGSTSAGYRVIVVSTEPVVEKKSDSAPVETNSGEITISTKP